MTRIVHTADWHLGARLIDRERHAEHAAFLDWFLERLLELKPDLLIVAGDIFDSATPPQEALNLYYRFLARLAATVRCQVLILGGNHDSPATLHAPRDILGALSIRVIATPPADPAEALIELPDAIVCAVPFLRERDLRTAAPGQSADEVAALLRTQIALHYRTIHDAARSVAGPRLLIATGHLTAVGSQVSTSERSIHIGNLGAVEAACFDGFAYTALGHIHRPQSVGASDLARYAGSPISLSFSEVDAPKEIRVLDLAAGALTHRALPVPNFRPLLRLTTTTAALKTDLARYHAAPVTSSLEPWIELTVTDGRAHPDLDRQVREAADGLNLRVLKLLTPTLSATDQSTASATAAPAPALSDLQPEQVFAARLQTEGIDPASDEGRALALTFDHLLSRLHESAAADLASTSAPAATKDLAP